MDGLKCSIRVVAGVLPNQQLSQLTRTWDFLQSDLDNPPTYLDKSGAAMNYAMSLQKPEKVNWVKFEWIWY